MEQKKCYTYSSDSISPTFLGLLRRVLLSNDATSLPLGMGPISLRNVGAAYANDDARNRFG